MGAISSAYATGAVNGNSNVGGLVETAPAPAPQAAEPRPAPRPRTATSGPRPYLAEPPQ